MRVATEYDAAGRTYTVRASQSTPPTPGQAEKGPVPIPIAVGLLGADGQELPLHLKVGAPLRSSMTVLTGIPFPVAREDNACGIDAPDAGSAGVRCVATTTACPVPTWLGIRIPLLRAQGHENGAAPTTEVLLLEGAQQEFVLTEVPERPVPSLLRGFSAPVKLEVRGVIPRSSRGPAATLFHNHELFNDKFFLHGCNWADEGPEMGAAAAASAHLVFSSSMRV